jgi:plasmid stabilization system protein ParE
VPKKYRVEIVQGAERDIDSIRDRIAADKPRAANAWARRIVQKIRSLAVLPERYEFIPEAFQVGTDYRHLLFR